jgi:nucleoside-diphosphate-sugar epimerase
MRVFLAGATGAIGRPLIRRLVGAGHQVTASTRSQGKMGEVAELGLALGAPGTHQRG